MTRALEVQAVPCADCGAPARAGETRCAACGAEIALPEARRALDRTTARALELDERTRALAARLGQPPSPLLAPLVVFESSCALPLLLVVLVFPAVLAARAILPLAASLSGRAIADDERYLLIAAHGFTLGLFALGLLGATWAGRRSAGLRELAAGLAARPPQHPGGASACRECGAALEVEPGARGARCRFCGVESLVTVDRGWLKRARAQKRAQAKSLKEALSAYQAEAARLRASFRLRLIGVAIVGGGFFALMTAILLGSPPALPETPAQRLARESEVPRLMVDRAFVGRESDVYFSPLLSLRPCDAPGREGRSFRFTETGCDPERCIAPWYVPLRAGDSLQLATRDSAEALVLFYPQAGAPPFAKGGRGELLGKATLGPDAPVALRAPADGWYLLLYSVPGAKAGVDQDLCVALERPR